MNETRFNEINLQMLSKNLYTQIFGNKCNSKNSYFLNDILSIKQELANFGIDTNCTSKIPNVNIKIPDLRSQNIEDHFKLISQEQVQPYLTIINKLINKIPPLPKNFVFKEGWTRYSNSQCESVKYPLEDGIIFDVEVCVKNGPLPIIATAVSENAWYSWISKYLIEGISSNYINKPFISDVLIPLENSKNELDDISHLQHVPKIIIGHNISFDRIRVREQYLLKNSATRFLDTMALHISISGTSSYQRAILKSKHTNLINHDLKSVASLNNLADVYKLYCGKKLDKTMRNIFINAELHQIREQVNESISYCASDVIATYKIFKEIFPIFMERFPHPATLVGMLELGSAYLPVNYNWKRYLEEADTIYNDLNLENKKCLSKRADQICRLLNNNKYEKDPWMWNEDWSIKNIVLKKGYENIFSEKENNIKSTKPKLNLKFKYLNDTKYFLPKKIPHMPGYPNWYRKLSQNPNFNVNLFSKTLNITTSMLITPKLLNLTWKNYPLYHIKEQGWGFLVPYENQKLKSEFLIKKSSLEPKLFCNMHNESFSKPIMSLKKLLNEKLPNENFLKSLNEEVGKNKQLDDYLNKYCHFFKLPHKNGVDFNVGNPLAKDFVNKFSANVLAGIDNSASRVLEISKMTSYWKNNRNRILSQLVIWLDHKTIYKNYKKCKSLISFGAIIPQIIVSGTLTRRAVEPTWMTASNAYCERIGSELRAMINAPPNYSIVGADVDSQELWIASIIGDALSEKIKIQGGNAFSWMTLIGNKSQGTDMHSVTAKAIGISRDQAKIINYARIYGAGQKFAEILLKQFNPSMTDKEAILKSKKMILLTKGQKLYRLKKNYHSESLTDKLYTIKETLTISQAYGKSRNEMFEKGKWIGGSESTMFNSLEKIAELNAPATPFLNSRLSRALETEKNEKHLVTKINWVVQSSAVDFLHLILVCMRWLMKDKIKLCLSFHDEVRYLVPSKYKYNAALAMHVTNLLVRCFFVSRLNMKDLPMSVAFFTSVEVDSVLRKEATQDCKTPSNPHGLQEGYGIAHGESLDVWNAIKKSKGSVGILNSKIQ